MVVQRIQEGVYPEFLEQLTSTIANNVHKLNIIPEASSSFYFDAEMDDEHVVAAAFESKNGTPVLKSVGYFNDVLTVQGNVTVNLELVAALSFFRERRYRQRHGAHRGRKCCARRYGRP
ncbi:hypothetical protein [Caballeronia grimmiae]|uniref:hypothetical protein n=1 Tax=Caballeronia grimmiae TaxID=1071679 RepID=UPI0038BBD86E